MIGSYQPQIFFPIIEQWFPWIFLEHHGKVENSRDLDHLELHHGKLRSHILPSYDFVIRSIPSQYQVGLVDLHDFEYWSYTYVLPKNSRK